MKRTILAIVVALTLTGCGGGDGEEAAAPGSSGGSNSSSEPTGPAPVSDAAPADASAVLEQLMAAGLPISGSLVITETNDPNNLIGRPGQYVSKVVFADERASESLDENAPSNDAGGSVEVFTDAATAQARSEYIQAALAKLGPAAGTEYHYLAGRALVRVTGDLLPSVAAEYEKAAAVIG